MSQSGNQDRESHTLWVIGPEAGNDAWMVCIHPVDVEP